MKTTEAVQVPRSRWVRMIVLAAGVLFSIQILVAGYAAPIFREMFLDFGSELPLLTRMVLGSHLLWYFLGLAGVVWSVILYRWSNHGSPISFRVATLVSVFAFLIGQTLVVGFFLPVLQLSQLTESSTQENRQ